MLSKTFQHAVIASWEPQFVGILLASGHMHNKLEYISKTTETITKKEVGDKIAKKWQLCFVKITPTSSIARRIHDPSMGDAPPR